MPEPLSEEIAELVDDEARKKFFSARSELLTTATLVQICDAVTGRLWVDLEQAEVLLATAGWLAAELTDDFSQGRYLRARANVAMFQRDHAGAARLYRQALERFEAGGHEIEMGATRMSGTHSLVYLDRFDEALEWVAAAREIFTAHGDDLRLARLDFNTGTLLARQDRFQEALEHYEAARRGFVGVGLPSDVANSLRNIAVCLQDLNRLREAEEAYRQASEFSTEHGLDRMNVELACNAAYLFFLRGEYARAISEFERARKASEALDDPQHRALADLDEAEVYLELNLPDEAERLARAGAAGFEALEMGYEAAKGKVFQALAISRRGHRDRRQALELLEEAKAMFEAAGNRVWPARVALHQAAVLHALGESEDAWELAAGAHDVLSEIPALSTFCRVLLARIDLHDGDAEAALEQLDQLLPELERQSLHRLAFQVHLLRGQALEAAGEAEAAWAAFRAAEDQLDDLRGQLVSDELKTAFLADKQEVYESLFRLALEGPPPLRSVAAAFRFMEKGKSQGLADLLAPAVQRLPAKTERGRKLAQELSRLRAEVGWLQRRIDRAQTGEAETTAGRLEELQVELRLKEKELLATVRRADLADHEYGSLQTTATLEAEDFQAFLPEDATLVEYFIAQGKVSAAVMNHEGLELVPLGQAAELEDMQNSFRFQMGKYVRGESFNGDLRALAASSVESRLRLLYERLVAPLEPRLTGSHLVVVPHGFLHWLPFHALDSGDGYLVDRFTISYAPSARVLQLCSERSAVADGPALVLGVADERAPLIEEEARAVAGVLPDSRLFLGEDASSDVLRRNGEAARYIHVATHGFFRGDHPMFSAVRLGDGRLSVLDMYRLSLGAELVVLSGCSTGLNVVRGGDEQVGLTRGVLYAGARSLMVTLWDVSDESTALLMRLFYEGLAAADPPAAALAAATRELRERFPEPYYWAPFMLTGWPFL